MLEAGQGRPNNNPKNGSKYLHWDVTDFLIHCKGRLRTCDHLLPQEKHIAQLAVLYLIVEADRPQVRRDQKEIRDTWRVLKPLLEKSKILDEFQGEVQLRHRVAFFLYRQLSQKNQ